MFKTINPFNNEIIEEYAEVSEKELQRLIGFSKKAQMGWRNLSLDERLDSFIRLKENINLQKVSLATLATKEMGKPLSQSYSEIDKCIWLIEYYTENLKYFLSDLEIKTDSRRSFIRRDPIGLVLAIMPWNFPYWQVFRFMVPTMLAGNGCLVKHAPNTFGCAQAIEELIRQSGFEEGLYANLIIGTERVEQVIAHHDVRAVTLTGSEKAGKAVASLAGKYLKKSVLELGGSNAFIVLGDADLDLAARVGATARMQNNGQSCIAAKRFLIEKTVYKDFVERFSLELQKYKMGDPMDEEVNLGPLARRDLCDQLENQVKTSLDQGAQLLLGGKRNGSFYEPTLLEVQNQDNLSFQEELFGPVAALKKCHNFQEAIQVSNSSKYGLGVSIITKNYEDVMQNTNLFEDGAVFINEMVKSDPRMPFGGTKMSGYGRELGKTGILEFTNEKSISVY